MDLNEVSPDQAAPIPTPDINTNDAQLAAAASSQVSTTPAPVMPDTGSTPGYYNAPTQYQGLPEPNLSADFENPYAPITPLNLSDSSNGFDMERAMNGLAHQKRSFQAATAPIFFDGDKEQVDRYTNSDYYQEQGFVPGRDNETLYAERQTFGDAMQHAFGGMRALTWNSFWDGWKGWGNLVNALFNWKSENSFKERLLGTSEELAEMNKEQTDIFNKYAIFATPESKNSFFNRQFLGNLIQQGGFAVGTGLQFAAEELLTMGAATFVRSATGLRSFSKALRAGITPAEMAADAVRFESGLWKSEKIAGKLYEGLKSLGRGLERFTPEGENLFTLYSDFSKAKKLGATPMELAGVTFNAFRRTLAEMNMALTESRMEAAGTYADLRQQLYDKTLAEKGEVSPEDEQRIEEMSQRAAWTNFGVNAVTISLMNRLQNDNFLSSFGSAKRMLRKLEEEGDNVLRVTGKAARDMNLTSAYGTVAVKAGERVTRLYDKNIVRAVGQVAKDFGKRTAAWEASKMVGRNLMKWEVGEGIQELIQEGSNQAVKDYYTDLYNTDDAHFLKSLSTGVTSQLNMQGAQTFLMGAMTGRLISPFARGIQVAGERILINKADRQAAKASRENNINILDAFFADPGRFAPEQVANLKIQGRAAQKMEVALNERDKYVYENAKDAAFAKAIASAKKLGMMDALSESFRDYGKHMNEQQFFEAFGLDMTDENRGTVQNTTNGIADRAVKLSKRIDELRDRFSDVIKPELYEKGDRARLGIAQRALDDVIEIMATNEFRAQSAGKRGTEIMEQMAKIPGVGNSAYSIFRVLGDNDTLDGEIFMLQQELNGMAGTNQKGEKYVQDTTTPEFKDQLSRKQKELALLSIFSGLKQVAIRGEDEAEIIDPAGMQVLKDTIKQYIGVKNEQGGLKADLTDADLDDFIVGLRDMRSLKRDERDFMDAYAFLANPKKFLATYVRLREGLEYISLMRNETAAAATNGPAKPPTASAVQPPDEEIDKTQVEKGNAIDEYHGFRVGDEIKDTVEGKIYQIKSITSEGVTLMAKHSGITTHRSLQWFDEKVGKQQLSLASRPQGMQADLHPSMTADNGKEGIFIVTNNSTNITEYHLVDEKGKAVSEDGQLSRIRSLKLAETERDRLIDERKKTQQDEDAPYTFDGKEIKYKEILKDANGNRFQVLTKQQAQVENGKPGIQVKALADGTERRLEDLNGFTIARLVDTSQPAKTYKISDARVLNRVYGVPQGNESQEVADRRLEDFIHSVSDKELSEKLHIKISWNDKAVAQKGGEGTAEENKYLLDNPDKVKIELIYDKTPIGYLPYYNRYQFQNEDGKISDDLEKLTLEQFKQIFDVGSGNEVELHREFTRYYKKSRAVYNKILDLANRNRQTHTIPASKIKNLFHVYRSDGELDEIAEPGTPLKDLIYPGVNGKGAVIAHRNEHQDTGNQVVKPLLFTEGDWTYDERQKVLSELESQSKNSAGATQKSPYLAVIELPNKTIELVPLLTPQATAQELDALVKQINQSSQEIKEERKKAKDKDDKIHYKRSNELDNTVYIHIPGMHRNARVEASLHPNGSLVFNYIDDSLRRYVTLTLDGSNGSPVSFANMAELLKALEQKRKEHNANPATKAEEKIGIELKEEHFRKHLAKDTPFSEIKEMSTHVSKNVVKGAQIAVTVNTDMEQPFLIQNPGVYFSLFQDNSSATPETPDAAEIAAQAKEIEERNKQLKEAEERAKNQQQASANPAPNATSNAQQVVAELKTVLNQTTSNLPDTTATNPVPANTNQTPAQQAATEAKPAATEIKPPITEAQAAAKVETPVQMPTPTVDPKLVALSNELNQAQDSLNNLMLDLMDQFEETMNHKQAEKKVANDPKVKALEARIAALEKQAIAHKKQHGIRKMVPSAELSEAEVEAIDKFQGFVDDNLPNFISVNDSRVLADNMRGQAVTVGEFIMHLVELANGQTTVEGEINISKDSPYKYHEAFHAIFRLLLTDAQIDRYLKAGKKEKLQQLAQQGKTLQQGIAEMVALDPVYYSELSAAQLEERLYEEYLADRFEAWKMKPSIPTDPANKNFFRKILDWIDQLIKFFTRSELDTLFTRVDNKEYKEAALRLNRFTQDPKLQVGEPVTVLKAIEIGSEWVLDPDGEMIKKRLFMSEEKSTELAMSVAASLHRRRETADPDKSTDEILDGVLKDFANLYNKNNPQYEDKKEVIGPELDKLRRVFTFGKDALKEAVYRHLRLMDAAYKRTEEEAEEEKEEVGDRAAVAYDKSKESIGGFGNLPIGLREYISTTVYEAEDAYHNKMLVEGEPLLRAVDANRVYEGILKIVANETDQHKVLLRMQEFAEYNPESGHFVRRFFDDVGVGQVTEDGYERLENKNSNLMNQVFKSFQQYTPNYLYFLKDLTGGHTKVVRANEREAVKNQFSIWYNSHSRVFGEAYAQAREQDRPALLERAVAGFRDFASQAVDKKISDEALKKASMDISRMLKEQLGVDLHPLYLQYSLLQHRSSARIETPYQRRLVKAFSGIYAISSKEALFLADSILMGKNPFASNQDIYFLQQELEGFESIDKEEEALDNILNDPATGADQKEKVQEQLDQLKAVRAQLRGSRTADTSYLMTRLAQSNALFDETVNTTSFRNADNELVYAHQLPTFHLVRIKELADQLSSKASQQLLEQIMSDPFLSKNLLLTSAAFRQMGGDLELARIEGMNTGERDGKKLRSNNGVTYGSFTDREMMLLPFELYGVNEEYKGQDGQGFATSRHVIRVLEATNTGDSVNLPVMHTVERRNGKLALREQTRAQLVQEVRTEWERIKQVKGEIEAINNELVAVAEAKKSGKTIERKHDVIDGYHNSIKDQKPRGLSFFKTGIMLGALATQLEEAAVLDDSKFEDYLEDIENSIDHYWTGRDGQVQKLIDFLEELKLIEKDKEKGTLRNILLPRFMEKGQELYKNPNAELNKLLNLIPGDLEHNLAQVLVNDFLNTHAFNQVLLGDQATALMDFVDMVKRARGANAGGSSIISTSTAPELGIEHANLSSHLVQIKSPKVLGRFSGNNKDRAKADSQMWMTVKGLRYTLFGLGRLTPKQARLLDKIERGESVNVDDIFGPGGSISYDGQTNSMKLVYYDPKTYIKTSAFILTKGFTSFKNPRTGKWQPRKTHRELDALRERLTEYENTHKTICMAVDVSASKCEKRNVAGSIAEITDWNFQKLDNRFWRLQSENPSNKLEITDPTQVKQLILTEQDNKLRVIVPFNEKGEAVPTEMSVGDLKRMYLKWTAQRSQVKYEQVRNEMFDMKGVMDAFDLSTQLHKVTPKLAEFLVHAVEVLRTTGANSQALEFFTPDENGGFKYNLNHPAVLDRFTNLFLSYFSKDVMNEKIPGYAATHASCYGIRVLKEVIGLDENGQPDEWRVVRQSEYEKNPEKFDEALEWDHDPAVDYGDNEELKQEEIYKQRKFHALKDKFAENKANKKPTYIVDDLRHNVPLYATDAKGNRYIKYRYAEALLSPHSAHAMALMEGTDAIPDALAEAFGTRIPTQDHGSQSILRFVDFIPAHYGSTIITAPEVLETSDADFDLDTEYAHRKMGYWALDGYWKFKEYGKVTDPKDQFDEYVRYQKENFALFRSRYRAQMKSFREEWRAEINRLKDEVNYLEHWGDVDQLFDDLFDESTTEDELNAKFDELLEDLANVGDVHADIKELHQKIEAMRLDLHREDEIVTERTLRVLAMPATQQEYMAKVALGEEPNIGKLNNLVLDGKMALHGNAHMTSGENPLAYRPTTPQLLIDLVKVLSEEFPELESIMQEGSVDPDTIIGKVLSRSNNKEGKDNIGPAVNSMLVCGLVNTFGIRLRGKMLRNGKEVELWRFKLDGHTYDSYEHKGAYNKETGEYDGERIYGVLSSLVSAMTDNAKERLAAKLGLNIDAVGLVSNLIAQGVPLRSAILFILQPAVRTYYKDTRILKSPIKTVGEEEGTQNEKQVGRELLAKLKEQMGEAEPVELTDALLRANIHEEGTNPVYQYSVFNAFLKLQEQTKYFSYAASVMKLTKGMPATHEAGNTMEYKMNALQLFSTDAEFEESAVPFDLRQVMTGADPKQDHNNIVANNIKKFRQVRELSKTLFLERVNMFQRQMQVIAGNLSIRGPEYTRFYKNMKWHWISCLSITAYLKALKDSGRMVRAFSLTNALIYDAEAVKMPDKFMDAVDAVRSIREKLKNNYFVNKFLNLLPTTATTKDGRVVPNPFNETGINKVNINTYAKLDAQQIEKLQDSFLEVFQDKNMQMEAWTLFHYLLAKDGGQFRSGSFLQYVPPEMFEDLMAATKEVNQLLMQDSSEAEYMRVLGMNKAEMEGRFFKNYLLHINNRDYVKQIHLITPTKDMPYKPAKAGLVDDYVPKNFTMGHENKSFVVNMMGGIEDLNSIDDLAARKAEGYQEQKVEKERARFRKNMDLLRRRGFRIVEKMVVENGKRAKKNKVQFPYVIRGYVNVNGQINEQYYVLTMVDRVKVDGEKLPAILDEGETSMTGEIARYELYGAPDGSPEEWAGATATFGKADTTRVLRSRGPIVNHRGFSIDEAQPAAAAIAQEPVAQAPVNSVEPPAKDLKNFIDDFNVEINFSPNKGLQFKRGGVLVNAQEQKTLEERYYERMGVKARIKPKIAVQDAAYFKLVDALVKFHTKMGVMSSYDEPRELVSFEKKGKPVTEEEHQRLLSVYSEWTGIPMERLTGKMDASVETNNQQAVAQDQDEQADEDEAAVLPDDYELPDGSGISTEEATQIKDEAIVNELKNKDNPLNNDCKPAS
jgi:hypothetical protein